LSPPSAGRDFADPALIRTIIRGAPPLGRDSTPPRIHAGAAGSFQEGDDAFDGGELIRQHGFTIPSRVIGSSGKVERGTNSDAMGDKALPESSYMWMASILSSPSSGFAYLSLMTVVPWREGNSVMMIM
jgi:hypothetical protein